MDKPKMHSVNKVDELIAKIGNLFPNYVTERKKANGEEEYQSLLTIMEKL